VWEGNSWKPINRDWEAGGVKSCLNTGGVYRQCAFRRNGGHGLWFDINERNVLVTNCVFEGNEGSGIFIEISKGIRVIHNLFIGNAVGVVGTAKPGWSTAGITLAESEDCVIEGNACVGNKDGIAIREQGPRGVPTEEGGKDTALYHCQGDVIGNNVCAFNRGYSFAFWSDNPFFGRHPEDEKTYKTEEEFTRATPADQIIDPARQRMTINNNVYFADAGKKTFLYGAPWRPRHEEFSDLTAFARKTGFDAQSRFADPEFVNLSGKDFRLKPQSPARLMKAGWNDVPADIDHWIAALGPTYCHVR
jgi:parallel beta-helix repeat protein